jgi:hypothetical protein
MKKISLCKPPFVKVLFYVQISRFKIMEDSVLTYIFIQAYPDVSLEGGEGVSLPLGNT